MPNEFSCISFGKGESLIGERTKELSAYYAAISVFQPLSADEEVELAYKIKAGDASAKEKLVNANLRAVVSIVRKHYANYGGCLSVMDLISAGNIGLMAAADKFDPTIGTKFLSFAVGHIRAAIIAEIKHSSRIVRDYHKDTPNRHTSLDAPANNDDDTTTLGDIMCVSHDAEHCASESLLTDLLRAMNSILKENEMKVLCVLYGIGTPAKSMWEVAEEMNKTEEGIRLLKERGINRLKINERAIALLEKYL